MKIRIGFVTNSSSYGFSCVHIDNPVLQDILQKYYEKNELIESLEGMDRFLAFIPPEDRDGNSDHTFSDEKDSAGNVLGSREDAFEFILEIINEASPGIWAGDGTLLGDFLDGEDRELFDLIEELKEEIRNNENQIMGAFESICSVSNSYQHEGYPFEPGDVVEYEFEYSKDTKIQSTREVRYRWKGEREDNWRYDGAGFEQSEALISFADQDFPFKHTYKLISSETAGIGLGASSVDLDLSFIPEAYSRSLIQEKGEGGKISEREPFMASFPHFINWELGDYPLWDESPSPNRDSSDSQEVFLRLIEEIKGKGSLFAFIEDDGHVKGADNQEKDHEPEQEAFRNDLSEEGMEVVLGQSQGFGNSKWEQYLGDLDNNDFRSIEVFDKGSHLRYAAGSTYLWNNRFDRLHRDGLYRPWDFDEGKLDFTLRFHLDSNTIDEAILRLQKEAFPSITKAIHFLFTPPENKDPTNDLLTFDHPKVVSFFKLLKRRFSWDIRVNAQAIPDIHRYYQKIIPKVMEPCEGGRFSCYISPDLTLYPCKYFKDARYSVSLLDHTLQDAWNSEPFQEFRKIISNHFTGKDKADNCTCSCPLLETYRPNVK